MKIEFNLRISAYDKAHNRNNSPWEAEILLSDFHAETRVLRFKEKETLSFKVNNVMFEN